MSNDEIIEQAARVLCTVDHGDPDNLIGEYDELGRFTTSEVAWTEYVAQARALAEAGLLARPLPTREEIANALHGDNCPDDPDPGEYCSCDAGGYDRMGDIVLDLLKGQEA